MAYTGKGDQLTWPNPATDWLTRRFGVGREEVTGITVDSETLTVVYYIIFVLKHVYRLLVCYYKSYFVVKFSAKRFTILKMRFIFENVQVFAKNVQYELRT